MSGRGCDPARPLLRLLRPIDGFLHAKFAAVRTDDVDFFDAVDDAVDERTSGREGAGGGGGK